MPTEMTVRKPGYPRYGREIKVPSPCHRRTAICSEDLVALDVLLGFVAWMQLHDTRNKPLTYYA